MYQASKYLPKFGKNSHSDNFSTERDYKEGNKHPSLHINVVVARRVHYKDYFMIPKSLQGLYLVQNLDTNYLL